MKTTLQQYYVIDVFAVLRQCVSTFFVQLLNLLKYVVRQVFLALLVEISVYNLIFNIYANAQQLLRVPTRIIYLKFKLMYFR